LEREKGPHREKGGREEKKTLAIRRKKKKEKEAHSLGNWNVEWAERICFTGERKK